MKRFLVDGLWWMATAPIWVPLSALEWMCCGKFEEDWALTLEMLDANPLSPSDRELSELIDSFGVPVRLAVGTEGPVILGWLEEADRENPSAAIAELMRDCIEQLDEEAQNYDQD